MWRDRWLALGVIGASLACLSCLTPLVAVALGGIGLGARAGPLDALLVLVLIALVTLAVYRDRAACRRTP